MIYYTFSLLLLFIEGVGRVQGPGIYNNSFSTTNLRRDSMSLEPFHFQQTDGTTSNSIGGNEIFTDVPDSRRLQVEVGQRKLKIQFLATVSFCQPLCWLCSLPVYGGWSWHLKVFSSQRKENRPPPKTAMPASCIST